MRPVDADAVAGAEADEPGSVGMWDIAQTVAEIMSPGARIGDLGDTESAFGRTHVALHLLVPVPPAARHGEVHQGVVLGKEGEGHPILVDDDVRGSGCLCRNRRKETATNQAKQGEETTAKEVSHG